MKNYTATLTIDGATIDLWKKGSWEDAFAEIVDNIVGEFSQQVKAFGSDFDELERVIKNGSTAIDIMKSKRPGDIFTTAVFGTIYRLQEYKG